MPDFDKAQQIVKDALGLSEWEALRGRIAVVEMNEKKCYISDDILEASEKAKAAHPDSQFVGIRIGFDAVYAVGAGLQPLEA